MIKYIVTTQTDRKGPTISDATLRHAAHYLGLVKEGYVTRLDLLQLEHAKNQLLTELARRPLLSVGQESTI